MYITRFFSIIFVVTLFACNDKPVSNNSHTSDTSDTKDLATPSSATATTQVRESQADKTKAHETKVSELDLSLPESLSEDIKTLGQHADKTTDDKKPILPDLFDKQEKEKSLSISGKPTLSLGEEPGSIPEVTGGELDVKLKLP